MFVCHYTRGHPRPPEAVSALPTPELHLPEVHPSLNRPRLGGTSPEASPEVHPCLGRPSGALPPEAQAARGPPERKPSVRASNRVGGLVVYTLSYSDSCYTMSVECVDVRWLSVSSCRCGRKVLVGVRVSRFGPLGVSDPVCPIPIKWQVCLARVVRPANTHSSWWRFKIVQDRLPCPTPLHRYLVSIQELWTDVPKRFGTHVSTTVWTISGTDISSSQRLRTRRVQTL